MDPELKQILEGIKDYDVVSVSLLQRNFSMSFVKATKIFNTLLYNGYVVKEEKIYKVKRGTVYRALNLPFGNGFKLIFLDIDGVLNSASTKKHEEGFPLLEDKKIKLLKEIVRLSEATLILHCSKKGEWFGDPRLKVAQSKWANYLDRKLAQNGLKLEGKTGQEFVTSEGDAILESLRGYAHIQKPVDSYLIISAKPYDYTKKKLNKNLILTDFENGGLSENDVKTALDILNG